MVNRSFWLLVVYLCMNLTPLFTHGQTPQTLGDTLVSEIEENFSELKLKMIRRAYSFHDTRRTPYIGLRWAAKDERSLSVNVEFDTNMVSDSQKLEKRRHQEMLRYVFRAVPVPYRIIDVAGVKGILVSRNYEVEILFFKENLRVQLEYFVPRRQDIKPMSWLVRAPKEHEQKILEIAKLVANFIDAPKIYSPCYNDFQKPIVPDGDTPEEQLSAAILRAEVKNVKKILKRTVDFGSSLTASRKLMHVAAYQGCVKIAELLIKAKANVNVTNNMGETPLIIAAREGNLEMVRFLLASGADATPKARWNGYGRFASNYYYWNAAFYTVRSLHFYRNGSVSRLEMLKLLAENGLDLTTTDGPSGANLLLYVRCSQRDPCPQMINFLLERGLDINQTNVEGDSVLMRMITIALSREVWDYPDQALATIKVLINKGANINARYQNQSVLERVLKKRERIHSTNTSLLQRFDEIIKILKDAGAK